jgi:hypothetical protein
MPRDGAAGKYVPLCTWLAALPADQHQAVLSLADIEALIGYRLPSSAWAPGFWASSGVARHNWRCAGFRARLDHNPRSVRFARATP